MANNKQVTHIFDDVDHDGIETAEDLQQRLMVESRRISTVRTPGRPPKCYYSKQQVIQVKKVRLPKTESTNDLSDSDSNMDPLTPSGTFSPKDYLFDDVDHDRIETAEDLQQRLMVESRRISTVRKSGRPPKCSYSKQQVIQVKKVRLPKTESTNDLSDSDSNMDPLKPSGTFSPKDYLFDDVDHDHIETAEDLTQQILVESRHISTVRKPGRPLILKSSYSKQQVTQVTKVRLPKTESTNELSDSDSYMDPLRPSVTFKPKNSYYCSVPQCKTKGAIGRFHNFPINPDLRAKWLNICQLSKVKSTNRVCQRHFNKSDYFYAPGTLNSLNEERRAGLNIGALPVLHLPKKISEPAPIIMATPSTSPCGRKKVTRCSVPLCTTKSTGRYHNFPANPYFRAKWQNICQLSKVTLSSVVCHRHFNKSDYQIAPGTLNDLNKVMNVKLNKGAFPVLHVPENNSKNDLSDSVSNTDGKRVTKCSVPLCTTKGIGGYHNIPGNPDLRAKWQNICQLLQVNLSSAVCQRHFNTSDYMIPPGTLNDLNEEIKPRLNNGACPSLHLPKNQSTNSNDSTVDVNVENNLNTPDKINDFYEEKIKPRHLLSTLKRKSNLFKVATFKCCVPQCRTKAPLSQGHLFPTKPDRRAKWLNICQLSTIKAHNRVCQLHFDKSDYFNPFNFNVLNEGKPLRLKMRACPSLLVPKNKLSDSDSSSELPTFVVKVEENVIAPTDTINVLNEDIKPSLEIGAFPY
jgi:hypothetical protein